MKRKLRLLLAMVLAITMVMGMSVAAFADGSGLPMIESVDITLKDTITRDNLQNLPKSIFEAKVDSVTINTSTIGYALYGADKNIRYYCMISGDRYGWQDANGYSIDTPSQSDLNNIDYVLVKGVVTYRSEDWDFYEDITVTVDGGAELKKKDIVSLGTYPESCYSLPRNYSTLYIGYLFDLSSGSNSGGSSTPAHTHNFTWQTITEPTKDSDGLEGEVCSCCATRNTQPLSAFGFILNDYAPSLIKAAKPGQTVTFEFGEWNSFPKEFMAKLVDKSAQNVTFVFHYKWNHVKQEITIPAGTPIDLNFDWYGPAKMAELYGNN